MDFEYCCLIINKAIISCFIREAHAQQQQIFYKAQFIFTYLLHIEDSRDAEAQTCEYKLDRLWVPSPLG